MAEKKNRTQPETPLPTDTPKDRGSVSEADTSRALSDESNPDALDQANDPDHTHPLPSDVNESGQDSTGGNAPFAPADLSPASADDDARDDTGQTGDEHGTSRRDK